jgi:hypothetical protein
MLDAQIVTAVATGNLKAISEQPAMLSNLAYSNVVSTNNLGQQNAVSNQQAGNQLGVPLVAKATNTIANLNPMVSRSAVDVLTNNELAQTIADLKSAVEAFAGSGGSDGTLRLADLQLRIDEQERLVVVLSDRTSLDIFIPGSFTREQVQVVADSARGVTIRVRKTT